MNPIRHKFLRATASADWSNGQRRRYARQFEASVGHLGDRWLLARPQSRSSVDIGAYHNGQQFGGTLSLNRQVSGKTKAQLN